MACACCKPSGLQCRPFAEPFVPSSPKIQLTVNLLSGAVLAKLTVEPRTVVAELKMRIERAAKLPPGRVVRWLARGSMELKDDELLQVIGIRARDELVAICADAIVGDFEDYLPGCPTCDYNSELRRVSFFADGTALIQDEKYTYALGELKDGTKPERELELVEVDATSAPARVYCGILQLSATNPIYRRVKIPELDIDVEDVRFLQEKGRSFLQQKIQFFFQRKFSISCWPGHLECNSFSYSEEDISEAYARAWASMQQREAEDKEDDWAEHYDDASCYRPRPPKQQKQRRAVCKRYRQRGICRWEREGLM